MASVGKLQTLLTISTATTAFPPLVHEVRETTAGPTTAFLIKTRLFPQQLELVSLVFFPAYNRDRWRGSTSLSLFLRRPRHVTQNAREPPRPCIPGQSRRSNRRPRRPCQRCSFSDQGKRASSSASWSSRPLAVWKCPPKGKVRLGPASPEALLTGFPLANLSTLRSG